MAIYLGIALGITGLEASSNMSNKADDIDDDDSVYVKEHFTYVVHMNHVLFRCVFCHQRMESTLLVVMESIHAQLMTI